MTIGALLRQAKALIDIGRLSCRADWSVFVGGHVAVAWHSMVVAGGVTVQVVNCAVLPRGHPIGMLLLRCLHATAVPQFLLLLSRARGCEGKANK